MPISKASNNNKLNVSKTRAGDGVSHLPAQFTTNPRPSRKTTFMRPRLQGTSQLMYTAGRKRISYCREREPPIGEGRGRGHLVRQFCPPGLSARSIPKRFLGDGGLLQKTDVESDHDRRTQGLLARRTWLYSMSYT
jgi:hypothetical protein